MVLLCGVLLSFVRCKDVVVGCYQAVSVFKDSVLAKLRKKIKIQELSFHQCVKSLQNFKESLMSWLIFSPLVQIGS